MLNLPVYIDERYRLEELIGEGGFCTVFMGTQLSVDRRVAVKLISVEQSNPTWIKRFEREAIVLARLKHPNTVKMFDYGVIEDAVCYLVMEHVDGLTLRDALDREGAFELERALTIIRAVLDSLQEAHSIGIIHRDLKPTNIMLMHDHLGREQVRVLDFGVAGLVPGTKVVKVDGEEITADGFIGTPRYAAPEQLTGLKLTPAADIYAIGLLLWELLIGKPAVPEGKVEVCLRHHLGKRPWRVPADAGLPKALVSLIEHALVKDPDARLQSCTQMLNLVDEVLEHSAGLGESSSEVLHAQGAMTDPNIADGAQSVEQASSASSLPGVPSFVEPPDATRPRKMTTPPTPVLEREVRERVEFKAALVPNATPEQERPKPVKRLLQPQPVEAPAPRLHVGLVGLIVLAAVCLVFAISRLGGRSAEPVAPSSAKISPEVARLLSEPLVPDADAAQESAPVEPSLHDKVLKALREDGWSLTRLRVGNNLGSVQVTSYKARRGEEVVAVEVVTGVSAVYVSEFLRERGQVVKLGPLGVTFAGESAAGKRAIPGMMRRVERLQSKDI